MNKKVAVQVITGNPISFYAYMHNFFTKWYHLVDKLYVQIDTEPTSLVGLYPSCKSLFYDICKNDPKVIIKEISNYKEDLKSSFIMDSDPVNFSGASMRYVVETCNEDVIFFTHDDLYITDASVLENHINLVKSGERDCIVVAASSLSQKYIDLYKNKNPFISDKLKEFLSDDYRNHIGLNTCYFIVNKSDLLKTKLNFEGANYSTGLNPYSIDYVTKSQDETMYMEHSIDVLLQLYNLGKTNPLIFCADDITHLLDLRMFKNDELFNNLKLRLIKYGHVHFSSASIIKCWFQDDIKRRIESEISTLDENMYYEYLTRYERTITEYVGITKLIDVVEYPSFVHFIKLYNEKINYVIECINEKFKYISLDPTKYNDVLYNNQYPYQIKLEKLPIDKIKRFINYV